MCGLRNSLLNDEDFMASLMKNGIAELAPMSTTGDLKIALEHSLPGGNNAENANAVLLRIDAKDEMDRGSELRWLSAFPHEDEFLYPPTTLLRIRDNEEPWEYTISKGKSRVSCKIVNVKAKYPT